MTIMSNILLVETYPLCLCIDFQLEISSIFAYAISCSRSWLFAENSSSEANDLQPGCFPLQKTRHTMKSKSALNSTRRKHTNSETSTFVTDVSADNFRVH